MVNANTADANLLFMINFWIAELKKYNPKLMLPYPRVKQKHVKLRPCQP